MTSPLQELPGRVEVRQGIEFGSGGGRPLLCDVFTPPTQETRRRSVLLIHGGGWATGDRTQLQGYGIALGRLGFVSVACEYRLSSEAKWPAQLHDVKAALRFMRAEHESLGIDPAKIAVSGNSAGAHLALMLAATPNQPEFEGEGGHLGIETGCCAAIAIYPPTDLGQIEAEGEPDLDSALGRLFGRSADASVLRAASPIHYARKDFPPTQLIHGNRDTTVPAQQSFAMYRALDEAGAAVELHIFNDAAHAFDRERGLGRQCGKLMGLFLDRHVLASAR